jgi:hypothetical protein
MSTKPALRALELCRVGAVRGRVFSAATAVRALPSLGACRTAGPDFVRETCCAPLDASWTASCVARTEPHSTAGCAVIDRPVA